MPLAINIEQTNRHLQPYMAMNGLEYYLSVGEDFIRIYLDSVNSLYTQINEDLSFKDDDKIIYLAFMLTEFDLIYKGFDRDLDLQKNIRPLLLKGSDKLLNAIELFQESSFNIESITTRPVFRFNSLYADVIQLNIEKIKYKLLN